MSASIPGAIETSVVIGGHNTYITVIQYVDRVFIVVSQLETFGAMLSASCEDLPDGNRIYHIRTLMGKRDEDVLTLCARRLVEKLSAVSSRSLLLGIGLRPDSENLECIREVIAAVDGLAQWRDATGGSAQPTSRGAPSQGGLGDADALADAINDLDVQ